MRKTPIMIVRSININRGGVTKATIKRANLLAEKYKEVIILTTLFQQNHLEILKELYETELSNKVKVYNFFEYYKNLNKKRIFKKKKEITIEDKELISVRVEHHKDYSYRYYQDGLYVNYKRFDEEKRLVFIDVRTDGIARAERREYDVEGNLVRVRHMDRDTNNPAFDQYYDKNNKCFLSVHLNPKTKKEWSVIAFNSEVKNYKNLNDIQSEWIEKIVTSYNNPVIIAEQRQFDTDLVHLPKSIKKISVIHSSHLLEPFNDFNKVAPYYTRLFDWANKLDNIILLTEEQKNDIQKVTDITDKIKVIPHAYNQPEIVTHEVKRSPFKVVVVARYAEEKRIDEIIKAFKKVVEIIPEATLEVYGTGPLEKELTKLIKKEKLTKSVKLKGYTTTPHTKYQEAACSVIISIREGFGMVITESLSAGTPVIAYDFKYGPRDIIKDNENGLIVENGNIEALSEAIIKILSNPELQNEMSKKAFEVKKDFSEERYRKSWLKLLEKI